VQATLIRLLVVATLLLAAVVSAYSNRFENPFDFDDSHSIVANAYLRDLGNLPLYFTDPETRSTLPTNRADRPVLIGHLGGRLLAGRESGPLLFPSVHILLVPGPGDSESSVYRILKAADLIASPAYIVMSASDAFKDPTSRVHEMWQTDFTYIRFIN
jgi:hypothetical protein